MNNKKWRAWTAALLAVCLLVSFSTTAFALEGQGFWPALVARDSPTVTGLTNPTVDGSPYADEYLFLKNGVAQLRRAKGDGHTFALNADNLLDGDGTTKQDYTMPVLHWVGNQHGGKTPLFIIAYEFLGDGTTDAEREAFYPRIAERLGQLQTLKKKIAALKKADVRVGGYHPADASRLFSYVNGIGWALTGFSAVDEFVDCTAPDAVAKLKDAVESKGGWQDTTPEQLEAILSGDIVPFFLDYVENHRIPEPVISSFAVGSSKGLVDALNHKITLRLPKGFDSSGLTPVVTTPVGVKAKQAAGDIAGGKLVYGVTPIEEATGVAYDGVSEQFEGGYDLGANLTQMWSVTIEEGDPYNLATAFSITTADGVKRYGKIDEAAKTITLNLPVGTDLTALKPVVEHTGVSTNMDGQTVDFSTPQTLTVSNPDFGLNTSYTVTVTAQNSAENSILSYKIGDAVGVISGDQIAITVPYGTDLATATPEVTLSEFAALTAKPAALKLNTPLTYTVTSQSGAAKSYTVTITQTAAATGSELLSFKYGNIAADINQTQGTVSLTVPAGTNLKKLAPTIEVSPFATVSPASGTAQDFTSPVRYTVTSQAGGSNTYTVTVTLGGAVENPYLNQMTTLRNNIVNRYQTAASDDWEWMNLGFYQHTERKTAADLPANFDLYGILKSLKYPGANAMTELDRCVMMLTAMGINASDLTPYQNEAGDPFLLKNGEEVTNLVEKIYDYDGKYTINGPIFALNALNIGNYTVPDGANWSREVLLEEVLNHVYGSDGFQMDMVGMLMQSIAPFQDDPVYGSRVQAKLEEGIDIILGNRAASGVDAMRENFSFFSTGAINSEVSDQVICALLACGIDPHTDPRFSDGSGKSVIQYLMDNFANVSGGYFHHTTDVKDNAMATYQGCYTIQWYLKFLENGGAGNPYCLYNNQFDFSKAFSNEANITDFVLEGKRGVITGDQIAVTLPEKQPLTGLTPELELSMGAKLLAPALPVNFVAGVPLGFTVQAADGKTNKTYYVTVTLSPDEEAGGAELKPNTIELMDKNQRELEILNTKVSTAADGVTEIVLTVGQSAELTALRFKAALSYGATSDPVLDGKKDLDLSDWLTVTVTAQTAQTAQTARSLPIVEKRVYRIKAVKESSAGIASFTLTVGGKTYQGAVGANTITVTDVPSDADVSALAPEITLTAGTLVCNPASGVPQNFNSPVSYTVSGTGLEPKTYTVTVTKNGPASGEQEEPGDSRTIITAFSINGVEGKIDDTAGVITVKLKDDVDVTQLCPDVTVAAGCTVNPLPGEVLNFEQPVVYTVTRGEAKKRYTVTVILVHTVADQLWDQVAGDNTVTDHQESHDHSVLSRGNKDKW